MQKEVKSEQEVKTESRRKFLKTAGKFAVYTPPALMLMSSANATYVKDTTGVIKKHKYSKYRKYRKYKRYSKKGYRRYFRKYAGRGYRRKSW